MDNIPEDISLAIRSNLLNIARDEGMTKITSYNKYLINSAVNLVTITVKYQIVGTDADGQSKTKSIFAKIIVGNKDVDNRELSIYIEVLPKIDEVRAMAKTPIELFYPKLYKACNEPNNEYFLIEDMSETQFSNTVLQSADIWHSMLALSNIAQLHALSYVLCDLKYTTYSNYCERYPWEDDKQTTDVYAECIPRALNAIKKMAPPFTEYVTRFEVIAKDYMNILKEKDIDFVTLNHGSPRINNLLFRYINIDTVTMPQHLAFIDFQRSYFGPAAHDISHFLATNLEGNILKRDFDLLIELYLECFKEAYTEYNYKDDKWEENVFSGNNALSIKKLNDQVKKYFKRGLILSCTDLWYMLQKNEEKYNPRIFGVVKFAVDREYI